MASTVKLVGGVTWVPELLDHNTEEWQHLASEVQRQVPFSRLFYNVSLVVCVTVGHSK
jgi:hypothetical protein